MTFLLFALLLPAVLFTEYGRKFIYSVIDRWSNRRPILLSPRASRLKYRCLIVLGSGGHTTEMLRLLHSMRSRMDKLEFMFVVAENDSTSLSRVPSILGSDFPFEVAQMKRIRGVGDSILVALFRAPAAIWSAFRILWKYDPDIIITNGPGTCIPILFGSRLLQFLLLSPKVVRIFTESFCRVKTISLTGRIVYPIVDSFILQWPPTESIKKRYPKARYLGSLL